jgi:peptidoglycan/LPS O-acetylase OafA/YrhL
MRNTTNRLDQLTSLRFFAALMIVIHHSVHLDLFGISKIGVNFAQGVSFFFVLSGFILAYVYPKLDTWLEVKKFLRARVARVYPAYVAAFLLGFWLIPYQWDSETAVAHLLMVQAWIPLPAYYFSYNTVAWSVSTELCFYLAFPAVLYNFRANWRIKLVCSGAILLALIALSHLLALPEYRNLAGLNGSPVNEEGILYINPLSRIFEFIFGMCLALAWEKNTTVIRTPLLATTYELGAIVLCAMSVYCMSYINPGSKGSILSGSTETWLSNSGSMFVFGLLIYVLARGHGKITKILGHPFLVLLGEISFSSYLIHRILLDYYKAHISEFPRLPDPLTFSIFFGVLLLSSYVMWTCIEMPGRRLIIGQRGIHNAIAMKKSWQDHLAQSRKPLLAGLALCVSIGFICISLGPNFITQEEAENITPASLRGYVGTGFGDLLILRSLDIACDPDGLHVKLAWESKVSQKLHLTNAIHLIDGAGKILGNFDYKQPAQRADVNQYDIWLDTLFIPTKKLHGNMKGLAIGLYDDSISLLLVDKGPRDWGGHRLIIHIDSCSITT